jgi:two-component system chemotaxis sensor kinase CheA
MIRNAVDHAIEYPKERAAVGKPEKGMIRLTAYHEGGYIIIEVSDDGRGLSTSRIRAKALANGLASESDIAKMSEGQIHRFIFAPGFSTAAEITHISGRGVGMDVVLNNIDQLGGSIDVKSVSGEGSVFTLKIPLTLAIASALIIAAGGERFAVPQLAVTELVRVKKGSAHEIERIKDTPVLRLRNKLLPLITLGEMLRLKADPDRESDSGFVVVMQAGAQAFGMLVDTVFHTEEIVVKPMASRLRHITAFSGTTILGDGSVIMILDPNGVADALGPAMPVAARIDTSGNDVDSDAASEKTSLLLFRAGSMTTKAVPLSLVTRLEDIDVSRIEVVNSRPMIQYRGHLMPLIEIDPGAKIRDRGTQPLLVFSDGDRAMALIVDQIIDIVEDVLDIEIAGDRPGLLGSAIVKGEATEIIDVAHFLPLVFTERFHRKEQPGAAARGAVLLVEDGAFFRNMLTPVISAAGYDVRAVASAEEALAVLGGGARFSTIVTDLDMPGMDGLSLAAAIKAEARTASIPMIALASTTTDDLIARVRAADFHDFVAKFDRQGLVAALRDIAGAADRAA